MTTCRRNYCHNCIVCEHKRPHPSECAPGRANAWSPFLLHNNPNLLIYFTRGKLSTLTAFTHLLDVGTWRFLKWKSLLLFISDAQFVYGTFISRGRTQRVMSSCRIGGDGLLTDSFYFCTCSCKAPDHSGERCPFNYGILDFLQLVCGTLWAIITFNYVVVVLITSSTMRYPEGKYLVRFKWPIIILIVPVNLAEESECH